MTPNQWPWSWKEELKWQAELRHDNLGWMEDLLDHMINDRNVSVLDDAYDPEEEPEERPVL